MKNFTNLKPLISVLMPAYNAEKYISESIESILNQSFKNFEFIIVDDCSSDRTWKIILEYAEKDKRIVAKKNKKNLGIAGNRNKLKNFAFGKYIVWQDADDIALKSRLINQFKFMESHPEVGICGGFLHFFSEKKDLGIRKYFASDGEIRKKIFRYSPVAQPGSIIRRSVFKVVGDYDLNYPPAEDLDMLFRIGKKFKFANLQEVVIRYREHFDSATFTKLKIVELKTISIRLRYCDNFFYKASFWDNFYCILQYISIFLISPKVKFFLFNFLRNSKH